MEEVAFEKVWNARCVEVVMWCGVLWFAGAPGDELDQDERAEGSMLVHAEGPQELA